MSFSSEPAQPWFDRAIVAARRFYELGSRTKLRQPALIGAVAIFSIGLFLSIRRLPPEVGLIAPRYLVLISAIGVPLAILVNSLETKLSAILVGAHFGWVQSAHIGLVSSAANMLPLPGGPLVRVAALKIGGASLVRSGVSTTLIAGIWLGLALSYAGGWIFGEHPVIAGPLLAVGGLSIAVFGFALYRVCRSWRLVSLVLLTKSASIGIGLLRMSWALAALGLAIPFAQISVFAVSDVAGSAVSLLPAGLGVNEAVAALLAPLIRIPAAAAFLAVSLNRVVALPVLFGVMSIVTVVRGAQNGERRQTSL